MGGCRQMWGGVIDLLRKQMTIFPRSSGDPEGHGGLVTKAGVALVCVAAIPRADACVLSSFRKYLYEYGTLKEAKV
ncbi:hypothetical protein FHEFKHOI_00667 [Candidatus Methanoperedenaceae archaeon GB50]|nr:hypothetical protein FHEFKHOI_00667 [Candidatus Methanoperedenaceae archaeon GB50]CAD7775468.1 MAG: hypothetical protein KBONHNOK_00814 [Candidatus Methanoperedenaceae archaeon GB50]